MPRRKVSTTTKKSTPVRKVIRTKTKKVASRVVSRRPEQVSRWKWGESYTSLLLGIVVVIVAVLFGVSIFKQTNHLKEITALSTTATPTVITTPTPTPVVTPGATYKQDGKTIYVVERGDSLWSISEHVYQSGYQWVVIAKANNLADPSTIHAGNMLVIPDIAQKPSTTITQQAPNAPNAITTSSYTVQKGDSLWDIAVRAYGDGYKWTTIAQANHLTSPGLIFSGNVLQIPR